MLMQDNPFADSTLYDVNTTYVPPDLSETVDAVVPAVPAVGAAAPNPMPAAAVFGAPAAAPPAVAGPAVPAAGGTVPALPFTGTQTSMQSGHSSTSNASVSCLEHLHAMSMCCGL